MPISPIAQGIDAVTISSELGSGDRAGEIYQRLLRERIVFLGHPGRPQLGQHDLRPAAPARG